MSHIFGPVPSRRLGRSLGVDLVPFKTCSYDCIYCQLGRTTCKTVDRRQWVDPDAVLAELEPALAGEPDYITLSGSGEPTLQTRLGELIAAIRSRTDVPVAVLTNGSLLWQEGLRGELAEADLVVPSLDAGNEAMFQAVNRPCEELNFERMLEGLIEFRRGFGGRCWLEVFLLEGLTARDGEVEDLVRAARRIVPDRIQLNTATRPTAEASAKRVEFSRMQSIAARFDPPAEVVADSRGVHARSEFRAGRSGVLEMLRRRPCSLEDIVEGLGMHRNEALKHIEELDAEGRLRRSSSGGKVYFSAGGLP
jgi:wyosine [tRNA(Phe)-imidazoG37] synthetase (radical SAM superfamily)